MIGRLRELLVPGYILLCLLLGGSGQGVWRNLVLQLVAVGIIALAVLRSDKEPLARSSKASLALVIAGLALVLFQLIPLPPSIWTMARGRELLVRGYAALGQGLPWLPISLTPYATASAWLFLLPPLAVLLGMFRLVARMEWVAAAILAGALLHVLLGAVQSAGGGWPGAWWYLYEITNPGAVGFFANRNHLGTLLLASIPLATVLLSWRPTSAAPGKQPFLIAGATCLLLLLIGVALNQSLAAIALVFPVIAASALLLPTSWKIARWAAPASAAAGVLAIIVLTSSPVRSELQGADVTSIEIRQDIWGTTAQVARDNLPVGTGFGSFARIYRTYEHPGEVDRTYINHAHNDYLELVLEAGAPGALLILLFFCWWGLLTVGIWRSPVSSRFAKAATISSAAILAHSAVDYPLRTAAVAVILAACLATMSRGAGQASARTKSESELSNHVVLG